MVKYYLRTAVKAITHNKMYSFVNIFGLTTGLWACLIVATVVIDDLSYDRQWTRTNDLYRVVSVYKLGEGTQERFASAFAGLGPELKKDFPQIESEGTMNAGPLQLKFNDQESNGVSIRELRADTSVWSMLDIKVVSGNPRHYVDGTHNLMISESARDKFFPGIDPVGKTIYQVPAYGEKPAPYLITGVIKDIPANTHLRADVVQLTKAAIAPLAHDNAGYYQTQYLLMRPGVDMKKFSAAVNKWYGSYVGKDNKYQFEFQSVKDVYLHSEFNQYQEIKGSVRNIYIFSGVAVLLLLIACINFINLSTARTITRLRETSVRKILGAGKVHIIFQFLTEAVLYFVLATVLALILYRASLLPVEHYLGHAMVQTFMSHLSLLFLAIGVILFVSLFTGIYPAWLLSRFNPAGALRGKVLKTGYYAQNWLLKSLVVVQFSISIVVLLAMIVVRQQVRFMENTDVGFSPKGLLSIASISWDGKADAFKSELRGVPGVEQFSITSFIPSEGAGAFTREMEDPDHPGNKVNVWYITGDINLARTLGLRLRSGRMFDQALSTDVSDDGNPDNMIHQPSLITASTAKMLHIGSLNEPLKKDVVSTPVGIVEDFHNESLLHSLGPTFILADKSPQYGGMLIRVKPGTEREVMISLQQIWKTIYPSKLLETNWVDDQLTRQYAAEGKLQQLFAFFSLLSMVLATMGVFGLIVHAAGQRIKEIGVRKVLGASVGSIVRLLSADYMKLVFMAILIASPLAWWVMNKWLEDFAYRIHIIWWMFALAGGIALLIAFATVGFQAVRSALANPVKSLRSE